MFVTIPHIQCDIKDCKETFRGDPGLENNEKAILEQASHNTWVIAETNGYGLHFCGAQHARVFFSNLSEAISRDQLHHSDSHVDGEDFFWNAFIGQNNARAMEQ